MARRFTTGHLALVLWIATVGLTTARSFGDHTKPLLAWILVAGAGAATATVVHRMNVLTRSIVDAMGYQIRMNGHFTDPEPPGANVVTMTRRDRARRAR